MSVICYFFGVNTVQTLFGSPVAIKGDIFMATKDLTLSLPSCSYLPNNNVTHEYEHLSDMTSVL